MSRKIELFIIGDSTSGQRALDQLGTAAERNESKVERTGRRMEAAGSNILRASRRYLLPAAAGSVAAFGQFDSKMTQSTAIMGDVDEAMRTKMADTAKQVSTDLNISSASAAEAYYFLSSAGLDAAQSVAALPQVAAFAKAGMFDMATATDLATDAQSALGLTAADAQENLTNLTRVTDVLVKANTLANASVEQFSTALTQGAAVAMRSVGMELEEGVALLAAFADQGIKGERAGTMLTATLEGLTRNARVNADEFDRLGIAVYDANGNLNPAADIVANLERALGGMSVEQQRAAISALGFNRQAQAGVLALLGLSETVDDFHDSLRDAGGTVQEVADRQMQSFVEQLGIARQTLVNAAIDVGEVLAPAVLKGADAIAALASAFAGLPDPVQSTILGLGALYVAKGAVLSVSGKLLLGYDKLTKSLASVKAAHAAATGLRAVDAAGSTLTVSMQQWQGYQAAQAASLSNIGASAMSSTRGLGMLSAVFGPGAPLLVGLAAATAGVAAFISVKREQRERIKEVIATLHDETGALTDNTNAWILNSLSDSGALEYAATLGIAKGDLTRALQGEAGALARVNAALTEHLGAVGPAGDAAFRLTGIMRDRNHEIIAAQDAWRREAIEAAAAEGRYLDVAHAIDSGLDPSMARLAIAQQAAADAAEGHTDAQGGLADGIDDTTESTEELTSATQEYLDQARAATDPVFALTKALDDVESAQDAYNEAVKEYGAESTEAKAKSLDLAQAIQRAEAAALAGDLSFGEFEEQLRTWVTQGHLTAEQAAAIRDRVDEARTSAQTFADGTYRAEIEAITAGAHGAIDALIRKLQANGFTRGDAAWSARLTAQAVAPRGGGGAVRQAGGAILDTFANGGLREDHVAQIAPAGAWRVWAEPETGGEAYIPLSPAKRARSIDIWRETGRRLDVFRDGGIAGRRDAAGITLPAPTSERDQLLRSLLVEIRGMRRDLAEATPARRSGATRAVLEVPELGGRLDARIEHHLDRRDRELVAEDRTG